MYLLKRTETTRNEPDPAHCELQPELVSLEEETLDGYVMFERPEGGYDLWRRQQPYVLKPVSEPRGLR